MFESALYYPTIDIHNTTWLKSAVLFWDRIETIVPESEEHPYHKRSTQLLQEEGILFAHKVNPFCEDISAIEQDVIKFMDTSEGKKCFVKPWRGSAVSMSSRRNLTDEDYVFNDEKRREFLIDKMSSTYRDFYIHVEKLPMMLRERLDGHANEDSYVWASRGFMSFYMTLLANRISQKNRMALLTDRVNQNILSNKILIDGLTPSGREKNEQKMKKGMMYQVIMDDIKVDPSISMEQIIQYKKDRRHELALFREEMDRLTAFDTDGMNTKDIEHKVKCVYMMHVVPAINNVKATMKDAGINWWIGVGTCVLTGLIPATLAMGPDFKTNIAIGASECLGLALTSVPYIRKIIETNGSPYSYLMKMNQQISVIGRGKMK